MHKRRWRNLYPNQVRVVRRLFLRRYDERFEVTVCARKRRHFIEIWIPSGDGDGIWERLRRLPLPEGMDPSDRRLAEKVLDGLFA